MPILDKSKSDGSAYSGSEIEASSDSDNDIRLSSPQDTTFEPPTAGKKGKIPASNGAKGGIPRPLSPVVNTDRDVQYCGLCARMHGEGPGECVMTDRSENLAEFREMLLLHADDEPWEQRASPI